MRGETRRLVADLEDANDQRRKLGETVRRLTALLDQATGASLRGCNACARHNKTEEAMSWLLEEARKIAARERAAVDRYDPADSPFPWEVTGAR